MCAGDGGEVFGGGSGGEGDAVGVAGDVCGGGDALVGTSVFLELAEGHHEGHAGIGACLFHGDVHAGLADHDGGEGEHREGDEGDEDHQGNGYHEREAFFTADPGDARVLQRCEDAVWEAFHRINQCLKEGR